MNPKPYQLQSNTKTIKMNQTRQSLIDLLIDDVDQHHFQHLYRNKPTSHQGAGWKGGLNIYSPNAKSPDPDGHFDYLNTTLADISTGTKNKIDIANDILDWGGMKTRFMNDQKDKTLLDSIINSANNWSCSHQGVPMNSSYTKVASFFGYKNDNTIWDSRVSTAICYRLAMIFQKNNISREQVKQMFPDLGYVPGESIRMKSRMDLVKKYFPDVYLKWSGHIAGSQLIKEISDRLVAQGFTHSTYANDLNPKTWTPWKVNMVFFVDDVQGATAVKSSRIPKIGSGKRLNGGFYMITNIRQTGGSYFSHADIDPFNIVGALNLKKAKDYPVLDDRRIVFEFYRPQSRICKISCRVRVNDPAFNRLRNSAVDLPPKQRNKSKSETKSIFVKKLGKIPNGSEEAAINDFIELFQGSSEYQDFFENLKLSLEQTSK